MKDWSALIAAGVFCWFLAIHPFVTYPFSLSLVLWAKRRSSQIEDEILTPSTVAICTCAYNEERVIDDKIANLLALRERSPDLGIFIYVDGASDRTGEIVAAYSEVVTADISTERRGKTYGMNRLVERSQADVIIFTDANVLMDLNAVENVLRHFRDSSVGCVCGNLTYTNSSDSFTAATGSLYWRLEQFIKRRESEFGAVMGADGSLFAVRRNLHRPPPDDIIDDMYVSFQVMCAGYRVIQVDDFLAFEESVTAGTEEFHRKVRIACQAFNVHRLIWPVLRARLSLFKLYMYLSHKWLRWLCIYFVALGACFLWLGFWVAGLATFGTGLIGTAAMLILLGAKWNVPLLSPLADILTALLGAGIGVWRSIRGDRFQTWQPAASIRQ